MLFIKSGIINAMVIILYNIRSLHNVGSIFRTADAVEVEKIYLCGIAPAPVDRFGKIRPQLAKVSLGAEKTVPWEKVKNTSVCLTRLKKEGYKILAIEQDEKSIPYYKYKKVKKEKIALVVGHEVTGLPKAILKKCDAILEIPVAGAMVRQAHHPRLTGRGKESLNVAVAFGVVAYHLCYLRVPR